MNSNRPQCKAGPYLWYVSDSQQDITKHKVNKFCNNKVFIKHYFLVHIRAAVSMLPHKPHMCKITSNKLVPTGLQTDQNFAILNELLLSETIIKHTGFFFPSDY